MGIFGLLFLIFGINFIKKFFKSLRQNGLNGFFSSPLTIVGLIIAACSGFLPIIVIGIIAAAVKSSGNQQVNKPNRNQYSSTLNSKNERTDSGAYPYTAQSSNNMKSNTYYTNYATNSGYNNSTYQPVHPNSFGLPSSPRKRRKIVSKFNDEYGLNLTSTDINRIVDASFMSTSWAREVCYMNQKYPTVYSWFASMNPWLKAYLFAFSVQNVSSDFEVQERIVFDTYDQIFSDVCCDPDLPIDRAIAKINQKYLTRFDETTFTIAYRYMESKGKKYKVSFTQVFNTQEDIDNLLDKYSSNKPQGTTQR